MLLERDAGQRISPYPYLTFLLPLKAGLAKFVKPRCHALITHNLDQSSIPFSPVNVKVKVEVKVEVKVKVL